MIVPCSTGPRARTSSDQEAFDVSVAPCLNGCQLSSVLRLPDVQNVLEVAAAAKNASNPARSDIVAKHALLQAASLTPLKPDLDWETFRLTILVLFHSGLWRRFADVKQAVCFLDFSSAMFASAAACVTWLSRACL